jgi:hypothetical protein
MRAVIEAVIDDKLKLQAAKRVGIEIIDEKSKEIWRRAPMPALRA